LLLRDAIDIGMTLLDTPACTSSGRKRAPRTRRVMSDGVAIPAWLLVAMAALAVWRLRASVVPALRFLVTHPQTK